MKNFIPLLLGLFLISCSNEREQGDSYEMVDIVSPVGSNASLPYLINGEDGFVYLSWVEKRDSGWTDFKYSRLENNEWTLPELIASGNDWFVNWADYPMIAVDDKGNMIAHYLAKSSSGTYSYDVNVTLKPADGNWTEPIVPHRDGTPTEHGFVTILPNNDGSFMMAWLDGRNTGGHEDHDSHGASAMTLRSATINMDGTITQEVELDNKVCDCCQTTGAILKSGPIIVYRDRSELEIRDIYATKKRDSIWLNGKPIYSDNWAIKGCPVNGPRASGFKDTFSVAWFTGAKNQPKVKAVFSSDGGSTFTEPILIDETDPFGRVDIAMIDDSRAVVSWLDQENENSLIKCREVSIYGSLGPEIVISSTDPSRSSGFPQMAKSRDDLFFAWTEFNKDETSIRLKKMDL